MGVKNKNSQHDELCILLHPPSLFEILTYNMYGKCMVCYEK